VKKNIWANLQRIIELSTQKIVIKFSRSSVPGFVPLGLDYVPGLTDFTRILRDINIISDKIIYLISP
jgi:hypothetical protein